MKADDLVDVYMEIADKLGVDTAVAIHELFESQQIFSPRNYIEKNTYMHN